jgi:hypothetical protein
MKPDINAIKDYIWLVLFYTILVVFDLVSHADLSLDHVPDQAGMATQADVDISARVGLYFRALGVFVILVIGLSWLMDYAYKKLAANHAEIRLMNWIALAGIFLLLTNLMNGTQPLSDLSQSPTFLLILGHMVITFGIGIRLITGAGHVSMKQFGWVFTFGVGSYFFVDELARMLGVGWTYLPMHIALIGLGGVLLFTRLSHVIRPRIMRFFRFAALLPIVSVASWEAYLTLDRSMSLGAIYFITFLLFVVIVGLWSWRNRYLKQTAAFGWMSFGLALVSGFQLTREVGPDLFEVANRILPLHQWYQFGRLPIVETFNSHLLSEILFPWLYSMVNGFQGMETLAWDYWGAAIYVAISYMVIRRVTKNIWIGFFFAVMVPFTQFLVVDYFSFALISVFLFQQLWKENSMRNQLMLFAWTGFLLLWRIDLGIANAGAVVITYIFLIVHRFLPANVLKQSGALLLLYGIPFAVVMIFFGTDPLIDAWLYVGGSQAYGLPKLTMAWSVLAKLHYFVFPAMLALLGIYLAVRFVYYQVERPFVHLLVLFMIVFYLINFQRGLVRHTLVINNDVFTSSFAILIFATSAYLFRVRNTRTFMLFCLIAFLGFYSWNLPRNPWVQHV